ncbi:MAG: MSMEG_0565 family glycosyltransferase [Actinomycetota bacterium]|nr:MSMEG_0565 family glycosyltransferase [Actinomycetota bacterium]
MTPDRSPIALATYSTKPRGGVVHTLFVAEALAALGADVEVIALGRPGGGFYRDVTVPVRLFEAPAPTGTLEERVNASVDALAVGLAGMGDAIAPVVHTQDCISARAACRVRDAGAPITVVRTVHHVDDFSTPALVTCQRQAIAEPDRILVVSATWQRILADDYGVDAHIVPNGVDVNLFSAVPAPATIAGLRAKVGATDRFLFLAVGGVEPRKGSDHLVRALGLVKAAGGRPVLAVVGGHSFQDHAAYRRRVLDSLPALGLGLGDDVVVVGTVDNDELRAWYHAADAFTFPSVNEGWGLAVLEAMAAGLAVVTSDLPVFREYLSADSDALLVRPGDDDALAAALSALMTDAGLRARLAVAGRSVAARYGWEASARCHLDIYRSLSGGFTEGGGRATRPWPATRWGCATDAGGPSASAASRPR